MENHVEGNEAVQNGVEEIVGHTVEYHSPPPEKESEEIKIEKPKPINYKLTFCRITLASRIFARNNYFPLFRVMTPKDARRRILRKLLGPMEHYIPVLMNHKRRDYLSKGKRVKNAKDYGKRKHHVDDEFRYVCPDYDQDNDKHRRLVAMLKTKRRLKGKFIYTIYERDTALVCNGQVEAALREGDLCDIMISDFSDRMIVRYRDGSKVTVPVKDYEGDRSLVFEGEGATTKETEDKHHYGRQTMGLAQIYEMKEKGADDDELERLKEAKKRRVRPADVDIEVTVKKQMKSVLDNLDYADEPEEMDEDLIKFKKIQEALAEEARRIQEEYEARAEAPPDRETIEAAQAEKLEKMMEEQPELAKAAQTVADKMPDDDDDEEDELPIPEVEMSVNDMTKTTDVCAKLVDAGMDVLDKLPKIDEINDIVKQMGAGKRTEMASVSGLSVKMGKNEKFMVGQMVKTNEGEVFVPGQTVNTDTGPNYMPGVTVNVDESPTFVAGLIMANDRNEAVFLPGQSLITEDGQLKFADEGEHIKPAEFKELDVELDVNEMNTEDEERKIAKRLAEEEQHRLEDELERQRKEKKRQEEERLEREKIEKERKEREDKEWAKLGAVERAKKERLRIEREKREQEKQRKEEAERDRLEKERQVKEAEERAKLRAQREEAERKRMERLREEKKRAREAARIKQEKLDEEKRKKEEEEAEAQRQAELKARIEEEDRKRAEELANYVPKEIVRKEIIVDEEKEKSVEEVKKSFREEERRRMQKYRDIKIKPIKKIEIPKIKKYEPFPPVVVPEKLAQMQKEIHSGNFFTDHRKFLPKRATHRLRYRANLLNLLSDLKSNIFNSINFNMSFKSHSTNYYKYTWFSRYNVSGYTTRYVGRYR